MRKTADLSRRFGCAFGSLSSLRRGNCNLLIRFCRTPFAFSVSSRHLANFHVWNFQASIRLSIPLLLRLRSFGLFRSLSAVASRVSAFFS
jgi:hypothetical protein